MPCHTTSNHITTQMQTLNANPKMNVNTVKCLQANEMITTCHMRHIFMPINQTNRNYSSHATICEM